MLDDPKGKAILELWLAQKDELRAVRTPRSGGDELKLGDLLNDHLTGKSRLFDTGEIATNISPKFTYVASVLAMPLD